MQNLILFPAAAALQIPLRICFIFAFLAEMGNAYIIFAQYGNRRLR
jgi:hypothetical protein